MKEEINKKFVKAVSQLYYNKHTVVGLYIGTIKKDITNEEKQYLKDNDLIYISPFVYRLSYVNTWALRQGCIKNV